MPRGRAHAAMLDGLGFAPRTSSARWRLLGGWRMRLNLGHALLSRADLLLLDEPTNHLDLDAVVWLERWLAAYRATLLVVSHDRDFLDACVTHVAHIEGRRLALYTGNYSSFEEQRAAEAGRPAGRCSSASSARSRTSTASSRASAPRPARPGRRKSRLKALDRLERVAPAHVDAPFDFEIPPPRARAVAAADARGRGAYRRSASSSTCNSHCSRARASGCSGQRRRQVHAGEGHRRRAWCRSAGRRLEGHGS